MVAKTCFRITNDNDETTFFRCVCMAGYEYYSPDDDFMDGQIAKDVLGEIEEAWHTLNNIEPPPIYEEEYGWHLDAWTQVLDTAKNYPTALIVLV